MRSASLPVGPKNDTIEKSRPAASTPPAADRYSVSLSRLSRFGAGCPLPSPTRAPVQKMISLTMAPKPRLNFLSAARIPRFPPLPERFGRWAVIAGASEGLGAAFAEALAARGLNLVLLARRQALLDTLAADLRAKHRVEVRAVACDLADMSFTEALSGTCAELDIGVAVYNAAFSLVAPLLDRPREEALRVVDVNVRGPVLFSHAVLPAMVARGRGALVLMSSLAGFQGTPKLSGSTRPCPPPRTARRRP